MDKGPWFRVGGLVALFVWTGCQAGSSTTVAKVTDGPPRVRVACADTQDCPESVALLVGVSGPGEPSVCTAALVGPRMAVTARHCVAHEIDERGGRCDGVWLGFADPSGGPPKWVPCARVGDRSEDSGTLFAPDYAVLSLAGDAGRPPLPLGRGKLSAGEVVRMIAITPNRFYDDVHEVRPRRCVVDGEESPTVGSAAPSTVRVLSRCPIRLGNSGAPLLDRDGRMRGVVHAGGPPYFAFGLMTALELNEARSEGL